ncbi:unnamed protein product [Lepeophtheirus salmonis]|uniref:(salmon louse) hypothetical protein n=1 Tax=Lepeophtheirus salmonis TaxID=72036 RepID=A0A7R8CK36_LEPSM|nr:unnamed protein product [Lepeophtheirus salmonis]CAF2798474.1 unnamed protein product [Lepeophtheirus salmonis]
MKIPNIERMTSFSKLIILCAATYEDIWIYGTDDCVIVEQKDKTMFGLYVHSPVTSLSFVCGSEVISVGLQDGTVSFWDINKRINVSNHAQIHLKPVSSIFLMPLSRSIVSTGLDVGTWGGELLRINIIDNEVSQKGLCCKGAICDIAVKLNVNDGILVSCSDTEGYVYIADINLTLKKCWKLGSPSLTLTGNKLSFLSESEVLIGCSDGCIRCFEFKSFNSNFYEYFNDLVNHRYHKISGQYKMPTFQNDVVVCMDSYEGKKVLGYNSDTVTSVIKIDEFTFASISLDKYCKIWKLKESDKIEQIGEFLSQVPLYKGGVSRYTKCIILGGAFGVLYFLKMKYYGFSL